MKQGIVLFAYNNGLDYIKLAEDVAKRANKFLNLPVTLVTDSEISNTTLFDNVLNIRDTSVHTKTFRDGFIDEKLPWKNFSRLEVFNLTPYDETIVLDVDYVIQSSFLKNCFLMNKDFLLYKDSYNLSGYQSREFEFLNCFSIPFYWATVLFFKKTTLNELFFNHIRNIRDNWNYYKDLYQVVEKKFRNDYAFSIAIHTFNGFYSRNYNGIIPGKIRYITDQDSICELYDDSSVFLISDTEQAGNYTKVTTTNTDVHVMNKYSLLRCLT
jgi:hypothetical protein